MILDDLAPPAATSLPTQLEEALAEAGHREAPEWWKSLDEGDQEQILQLWEDCVSEHPEQRPRVRVKGRPVPPLEDEFDTDTGAYWNPAFYNYLVNHEIGINPQRERRFHVCTQHPLAKAAIESGTISHEFTCALDRDTCPMERLLKLHPGRALRLELGFGV